MQIGKMLPKFSIVMPSYNQGDFIEDAILSILNQDYPNFELFVEDGGSTDNTKFILEKYADKITNIRSGPDEGQADAVNRGWKRSSGEILGWLNSDDVYAPGAFSRVAEYWHDNKNALMFYGDALAVNEYFEPIRKKIMKDYSLYDLLKWKSMPQPAVFITPKLLDLVGEIRLDLNYSLDYEFFLRAWLLQENVDRYFYVNAVLAYSREYPETKMGSGKENIADERLPIMYNLWNNELSHSQSMLRTRFAYSIGLVKQGLIYQEFGALKKAILVYVKAIKISPCTLPYLLKRIFFIILNKMNNQTRND